MDWVLVSAGQQHWAVKPVHLNNLLVVVEPIGVRITLEDEEPRAILIFMRPQVLEKDMIFSERFETDDSIGWFEGNYYLTIEGTINPSEQEAIEKLKSVFIQD